jgi:hypothetical protein
MTNFEWIHNMNLKEFQKFMVNELFDEEDEIKAKKIKSLNDDDLIRIKKLNTSNLANYITNATPYLPCKICCFNSGGWLDECEDNCSEGVERWLKSEKGHEVKI